MQQKKADDYVIATGKQYSVKQFINYTVKKLDMKMKWKGKELMKNATIKMVKQLLSVVKNIFVLQKLIHCLEIQLKQISI